MTSLGVNNKLCDGVQSGTTRATGSGECRGAERERERERDDFARLFYFIFI